jgi:tRNA1Val (adenine37-N6)-methyltransferase
MICKPDGGAAPLDAREAGETVDTVFGGRLSIVQGKEGYRFSLDSVLLARFASPPAGGRVIDLGSGNGAVALMLAFLHPQSRVSGLELQGPMLARAAKASALNSLEGRVEWVRGDVREIEGIFPERSFDAAVSNPPYRRESSGRTNPNAEKRLARHEIQSKLGDFVRAGAYLLRHGGKMALVYPAGRALDLLETMRREGLEPKRLRTVQSSDSSEATLVLVEGVRGGRPGLKILPPLVVYAPGGGYTAEMESLLGSD